MKTLVFRLAIALAFAAAAWLSRSEATLAARVADAKQQIATLKFEAVDPDVPDRAATASVAYWLGRYDEVAGDSDSAAADADILLAAANGAFRSAQRNLASGPAAVQQFDGVLQAYAAALKASPRNLDAAYNYEFVAKLRDQVARAPQGKNAKAAPVPPAAGGMIGDLPLGPTVHGRPGAPPPDAKMEELQMIAPMDYGDRETQPEATPGAKRERKG